MLETVIQVLAWITTGSQLYLKADDNNKKSLLFSVVRQNILTWYTFGKGNA